MNSLRKSFGIFVCAVLLVFGMAGCPSDGGNTTADDQAEYTSYADWNTYHLYITKDPARAAFAPHSGDSYVLTITYSDGTKITSTGTVTEVKNGGTLELKQKDSDTTFTVTVNASGILTKIEGSIPTDNGTTIEAPAVLLGDISLVGTKWVNSDWDYILQTDGISEEYSFVSDSEGVMVTKDWAINYTIIFDFTYSVSGNTVTMSFYYGTVTGTISGDILTTSENWRAKAGSRYTRIEDEE